METAAGQSTPRFEPHNRKQSNGKCIPDQEATARSRKPGPDLERPARLVDSLSELPAGAEVSSKGEGPFDFVHLFVTNSQELERLWPTAREAAKYDGLLWISYPKRSAKVKTDLSREAIWKWTAGTGLRPVTQISIDEVWSALRFRSAEKVGA